MISLLTKGEYGVLSMVDHTNIPYAVPTNFVFDGNESIYIHCAPEGRKLKALSYCNDVTYVIVGTTHVLPARFTTNYESIVIRGKAHTGLPEQERYDALRLLLEKYSPEHINIGMKYAEKSFHRTELIRIDIQTISGKAKMVPNEADSHSIK